MQQESRGWFEWRDDVGEDGQRYTFRLDGRVERPDPASRWQPDGVHRPSALFRPEQFAWTDFGWSGRQMLGLVFYELHVGTFTQEGTLDAVIPRLPELVELGVTAIELMPVSQFPGNRGWGYDGTYLFAVQNSYGGPRSLQRFVDAAHSHGLAVFLDVVYNHLGPEGNYAAEFGDYFTHKYQTPWGPAFNFDAAGCDFVRQFVTENVRYWLQDFHLDGLRLDAVHAIMDISPTHILRDIQRTAEQFATENNRAIQIIAESDLNDVRLIDSPNRGGYGLAGQWSDDFHHALHTLLTDESVGYYVDFGEPEQLVKALNDTFVYDGCYSLYRRRKHGAPATGIPRHHFVVSIQNHDQVGNRALGDRLSVLLEPAKQRLAAGLQLLSPMTPLIFMGEEYGEENPFPFFCDFGDPRQIDAVRTGRQHEFSDFQ
jgi:maltooligosyltrehalose trehalohydrolase